MATHCSVLAWRIPGTGEPGGLPSMGSHRVRHDWSDLAAVAAAEFREGFLEELQLEFGLEISSENSISKTWRKLCLRKTRSYVVWRMGWSVVESGMSVLLGDFCTEAWVGVSNVPCRRTLGLSYLFWWGRTTLCSKSLSHEGCCAGEVRECLK